MYIYTEINIYFEILIRTTFLGGRDGHPAGARPTTARDSEGRFQGGWMHVIRIQGILMMILIKPF